MRCSDKVVRAAKVVSLEGLTDAQLQSVYLRFARELYILSSLKSDRVVAVHGAATSCTQLALVMEYMRRGSLRGILDSGTFLRDFLSIFLQNALADRSAPATRILRSTHMPLLLEVNDCSASLALSKLAFLCSITALQRGDY
jgi:serine/threonine protein kinase